MLSTFRFLIEFVRKSILTNYSRSIVIVFSFILILSGTVAMLGWLEASPQIVVDKVFESRGYEIKVTEPTYETNSFGYLEDYLTIEPLIESTSIIHKSLFLYNLENRDSNFSISNPPSNESDFIVSSDDLSDGVFFITKEFLTNIQGMLVFEEGSNATFISNGVIISRRVLNQITKITNENYSIGDTLNFAFARGAITEQNTNLSALNPRNVADMTINAIYDREPYRTQFGLEFFHETLGDGILVSHNLLTEDDIIAVETAFLRLSRTMFVRMDRNLLSNSPITEIIPQITNLASRIRLQGSFVAFTQNEESDFLLFYYNQSRITLLLLLLPLIILIEIFYIALIPHLLSSRTEEFHYLRVRGTTDMRIFFFQGIEFAVLAILGTFLGIFGGGLFLDVLTSTTDFLSLDIATLGSGLELLTQSDTKIWIYGVIFILIANYAYFLQRLGITVREIQLIDSNTQTSKISGGSGRKGRIKLIVTGLAILFFILTIVPQIIRGISLSEVSTQLVPLISAAIITVWLLLSIYSPQFALKVIQSFFESLKVFRLPKRKLTLINLFRRRAQYLSFLALLTITISLLSFSLIYFETISTNNQKNASFINGGDLKIITNDVDFENFSTSLESLEEVTTCVSLPFKDVLVEDFSIRLIGINPSKYYQISDSFSISILEGPPSQNIWDGLESWNNTIIMNDNLAEVFKWGVGREIGIKKVFSDETIEFRLNISAIISNTPGIGQLYTEGLGRGNFRYGGIGIVHERLLSSFGINNANTYLIRTTDLVNQESTIVKIQQNDDIRMIYTFDKVMDDQQIFFQLAGVQGILTIDFLGSILISLIGIAIFYYYLIKERITEFAVFQALGATKRNIISMVFLESLFLIIFGVTLGFLSGGFFAMTFLIATRGVTIGPYNVFLLEMSFSPVLLALSLGTVSAFIIIATVLPLKRIYSQQITKTLRGD